MWCYPVRPVNYYYFFSSLLIFTIRLFGDTPFSTENYKGIIEKNKKG